MEASIKSKFNYNIPVRYKLTGNEKKVVVMAHGFASSKASSTVTLLMYNLPQKGIGVVAFDFPGHGESAAGELSVINCINDLESTVDFAKEKAPDAEIVNFGSSFGAYISMLYITKHAKESAHVRAFLRSAAVNMPVFFTDPTPEDARLLSENGYLVLENEQRDLIITSKFISELQENDLFTKFNKGDAKIKMIHGTSDETIEYTVAKAFSTKYNIDLIDVPGGDHQLSIPSAPEKVIKELIKFIEHY